MQVPTDASGDPSGRDPAGALVPMHGAAYLLALRILRSAPDAEDAVGQAYLSAVRSFRSGAASMAARMSSCVAPACFQARASLIPSGGCITLTAGA